MAPMHAVVDADGHDRAQRRQGDVVGSEHVHHPRNLDGVRRVTEQSQPAQPVARTTDATRRSPLRR